MSGPGIFVNSYPKIISPDHLRGVGLWRGICLQTDPYRMIGWASVEHPELQSHEEIELYSGSIYALFLERCEEKGACFIGDGRLYHGWFLLCRC